MKSTFFTKVFDEITIDVNIEHDKMMQRLRKQSEAEKQNSDSSYSKLDFSCIDNETIIVRRLIK